MKRFQGAISQEYDFVPQAVPSYFELQDRLASRIAAQYSHPVVVDIGLGTGITSQAIIAKNPGCVVRGVDSERSMTDQARSNLELDVARGAIEIHESDALDYLGTLPDASVDVVASAYTMHNCLKSYRVLVEAEMLRVLVPGGMFINNDKYAVDDRSEYLRELTDQIIRYDVLREVGRDHLRRIWIEHEVEDQLPERIMWTREALDQLRSIGFEGVSLVERIGQYAIMTAYKPRPDGRSTGASEEGAKAVGTDPVT